MRFWGEEFRGLALGLGLFRAQGIGFRVGVVLDQTITLIRPKP